MTTSPPIPPALTREALADREREMDIAYQRAGYIRASKEEYDRAVGRASWWRRLLARRKAARLCQECRNSFNTSPPYPTGAFSDGGAWCHIPVPPYSDGNYPGASMCKASWRAWEPLRKMVESDGRKL